MIFIPLESYNCCACDGIAVIAFINWKWIAFNHCWVWTPPYYLQHRSIWLNPRKLCVIVYIGPWCTLVKLNVLCWLVGAPKCSHFDTLFTANSVHVAICYVNGHDILYSNWNIFTFFYAFLIVYFMCHMVVIWLISDCCIDQFFFRNLVISLWILNVFAWILCHYLLNGY